VASLRKALAKEQDDHALTKKTNATLNQKYCDLDESTKSLSCNIVFSGRAPHISLRQRMPLLPPLANVVENTLILI
jgi:hypothetical protein